MDLALNNLQFYMPLNQTKLNFFLLFCKTQIKCSICPITDPSDVESIRFSDLETYMIILSRKELGKVGDRV